MTKTVNEIRSEMMERKHDAKVAAAEQAAQATQEAQEAAHKISLQPRSYVADLESKLAS